MKPINHSGPSIPLLSLPDKEAHAAPAEQPAAESGNTEKKALPSHALRPGQANPQRFLAVHGKAGDEKANWKCVLPEKKSVY